MYPYKESSTNLKSNLLVYPGKFSFSASTLNAVKDFSFLIVLVALSIFVVYDLPQRFSNYFFLGILILFWFSNKDYLWFSFYFILSQAPAGFFSDYSATSQYRIPLYSLLSGISFSALDFFVILALFKGIMKGKKIKLKLEKPLFLILLYIIFSFFLSIAFDTPVKTLANLLRGAFYYSIIISFAYLIKTREEAYRFIISISPMVFFILFTQIYYLLKGVSFVSLFHPGFTELVTIEGTRLLRPTAEGALLVFFSYIFSLFLIETRGTVGAKKYFYLIIGTAYIAVIISATRIWFAVFLLVFAGCVLTTREKMAYMIKMFFILSILFIILIMSGILSIDFLFKGSFSRLSQIALVATGNFHSVGTFEYRYFVRLPKLLEGLKKHLIFGCGFSNIYLEYRDYHVGFFNTILQFGILGFSLFIYFFQRYFLLIKTTVRKLSIRNPLRAPLKMFAIFFSGILLAHFTTWYFFPMSTIISIPFFISVFIGLTELFVREANNEELLMARELSNL